MSNYGLLGEKLGHSYSALIHRHFALYDYELWEQPQARAADFIRHSAYRGLNVTIPYKQLALQMCDVIAPEARRIGSVNTIVRQDDGSLHGYNTDYAGFLQMCRVSGLHWAGQKVVILGTGGTALTARAVTADTGAGPIVNVSRQGEITYENVVARHGDAAILINATPVGMFPHNGSMPVDPADFPDCRGVVEVIYNPRLTRLALAARARALPFTDGLLMLVAQAKAAAELFTGRTLPDTLVSQVCAAIRRQTLNIVLIGMPGCGKSSLGTALAAALQREFIDTDALIAAEAGCSIPEIFASEGESGFRAREAAVIADCGKGSGRVIATGGGAVLAPENRLNLAQNSRVYWVERDISRLSREGRPLSTGRDALQRLAEIRYPLYAALADCRLDNNGALAQTLRQCRQDWELAEYGTPAPLTPG